jgi:hypothetical protein
VAVEGGRAVPAHESGGVVRAPVSSFDHARDDRSPRRADPSTAGTNPPSAIGRDVEHAPKNAIRTGF